MSRSYKKSYSYIACCRSQKNWRSDYNRRFRHAENARVNRIEDYTCMKNPYKLFYADVWCGPTDGKAYYFIPSDALYSDWSRRRFCKFKRHGHFLFHK